MLASMTWSQFLEWEEFEELERFSEERADYRSAHIVQSLWNIARDRKANPNGWPIADFLLAFGDSVIHTATTKQSLETQELHLDAWIIGNNAFYGANPT
jgi:hypothetical protein